MPTDAIFWSLVVGAPTAASSLTPNFHGPYKNQVMALAKNQKDHAWTGRKSLAAAIKFWLSTVIHPTCRCHSGGMFSEMGGGANNEANKEE